METRIMQIHRGKISYMTLGIAELAFIQIDGMYMLNNPFWGVGIRIKERKKGEDTIYI